MEFRLKPVAAVACVANRDGNTNARRYRQTRPEGSNLRLRIWGKFHSNGSRERVCSFLQGHL